MPVAQHPVRWWDWCIKEGKKNQVKSFLIDEKQYKDFAIFSTKINMLINYQLLSGVVA